MDDAEFANSADSVWLRTRFGLLVFLAALGLLTPVLAIFSTLPAVCCPEPGPPEEIVAYAQNVRLFGLVVWGGLLTAAIVATFAVSRRSYCALGHKPLIQSSPGLWIARVALAVGLVWIARSFPGGNDESWAFAFFLPNVWDFSAVAMAAHFAVTVFFVFVGLTWRGHAPHVWLWPVILAAAFGARNLGLVWALATGQPAAPF